MYWLLLATLLAVPSEAQAIQNWMEQALYPVLFGILVLASLGVPIPEDIPLIVAGVLMRTYPGIASWPGTLAVGLAGIMTGDLVLYMLGRRWGPDVVAHRSVRWIITPQRFARASEEFHRYGVWFCFFGRFVMGVRAVMCLTAGATRFPYWRFFLADLTGALISTPLFVYLGYWFAGMLPALQRYLADIQGVLLAVGVVVVVVLGVLYRRRRRAADGRPVPAALRGAASTVPIRDIPVGPASPAEDLPGLPGQDHDGASPSSVPAKVNR